MKWGGLLRCVRCALPCSSLLVLSRSVSGTVVCVPVAPQHRCRLLAAFRCRGNGSDGGSVFHATALRRRASAPFFSHLFASPSWQTAKATREVQPAASSSVAQKAASPLETPPSSSLHGRAARRQERVFDNVRNQTRGIGARRNCVTVPTPSRESTAYEFPVGRALRYVRQGRLFHLQTEGQEEVEEWLSLHSKQHGICDEEEEAAEVSYSGDEEDDVQRSSASGEESYEACTWREVSMFTKYHSHHVVVEFKKLRRQLGQQHGKKRLAQQHDEKNDLKGRSLPHTDRTGKSTAAAAQLSAPTLSLCDIDALTRFLFAATLLLRLGGQYSVADTHVEPLLDVCFSVTIFLAQDAATTARRRSATQPATSLLQHRQQHSLHWSIVHFAAATQLWGLLEHASPLQNLHKTQRPYERLLQVHAALLCDLTRKRVDQVVWRELLALKLGRRAPAAQAAWFVASDAHAYQAFLDRTVNTRGEVRVPPRLQQRRLQLLPILWLSLLSAQLTRREWHLKGLEKPGAAMQTAGRDTRETTALLPNEEAEVNWGSARHAFNALLPLFAREAGLDVTSWALMHLLFVPTMEASTGKHCKEDTRERASLTETCALLARVEQSGAAQELGSVLSLDERAAPTRHTASPFLEEASSLPTSSSSSPFLLQVTQQQQQQQQRTCALLGRFLRCFIDEAAAADVLKKSAARAEDLPRSASSFSRPSVEEAGDLYKERRMAPRGTAAPLTLMRRPVQLYRALLNIPLCTICLPPRPLSHLRTGLPQPLSSTLPASVEGVRLANALLLRVLVQWRAETVQPTWQEQPPFATTPSRQAVKARPTVAAAVAAARAEWEREVFCIMQAAYHLLQLLDVATAAADAEAKTAEDNAASSLGLLTPTVQAAARALSEQLGGSLLPRRLALVARGDCPLRRTEQQLLQSLDAVLRRILLGEADLVNNSGTTNAEDAAGTLPWSYKKAYSDLYRDSARSPSS